MVDHVVDNRAAKAAAAESRKRAEEDAKKVREEQLEFNNKKMAAESKYRPTPTPDEIARAASGGNVDEKEPDGSPEQNPLHPLVNAAQQIEVGNKMAETKPAGAYVNRQATTNPSDQSPKQNPPKT